MNVHLSKESKVQLICCAIKKTIDSLRLQNIILHCNKPIDFVFEMDLNESTQSTAKMIIKKGFLKKPVEEIQNVTWTTTLVKIYDANNQPIAEDLKWGNIVIKSMKPEYDRIAESIAQELENQIPNLTLVLGNPKNVKDLINPSRR